MRDKSATELTLLINVGVKVSWSNAIKMRLMGRYPAAIIARAVADRLRESK